MWSQGKRIIVPISLQEEIAKTKKYCCEYNHICCSLFRVQEHASLVELRRHLAKFHGRLDLPKFAGKELSYNCMCKNVSKKKLKMKENWNCPFPGRHPRHVCARRYWWSATQTFILRWNFDQRKMGSDGIALLWFKYGIVRHPASKLCWVAQLKYECSRGTVIQHSLNLEPKFSIISRAR